MSTAGRQLLSSLVYKGDLTDYLRMGLREHLFKDGEMPLFLFITDHVSKYGALPKPGTIEAAPDLADALTAAEEPPKFYLEETRKRYLHTTLKSGVNELSVLLTDQNAEEALNVLMKLTMNLHRRQHDGHVTDFRDAQEIIYAQYVAQKKTMSSGGIPYGWPTLDEMTGGARPGDFNTIVGRPMMGKTFLMLHAVRNAWKAHHRPLFVSMEMTATEIHERLTAMDTQTKLTNLIKAELSTKAFKAMMDKRHENKEMSQPLHVVDSSVVSTIDDLIMQVNILQPTVVKVDAAYLLQHSNQKLNKFDRQSENAEALKKRVAGDFEIPVTASYQMGKEGAKNKKKIKGYEEGMEDVYGADAMAQLSSLMLGLFQHENDIEALTRRRVKILKGRKGERGEFTINWDFSAKMDFTEFVLEDPKDLQMEHLG